MTQEELIERGVAAKLLLSDPRFSYFFDETKRLLLECIGNTIPEASTERETLYLRYNALNELLGTMQSYVDAAEAILEENEQKEDLD